MKRTKFIKNLITLALCAMMLLGFGTAASAASDSVVEEETTVESAPVEDTESNVFEELYAAVGEFSGEIASALAFIGSLIVAFAYKRGLMPTVKSGIGAIGGAVSQLKDSTESYSKHQDELLAEFTERLARAEEVLEKFGNAIEEIAEKTEDGKHAAEDRANMKALMAAQIDMLYDIFMTSSLPQYQKDAVNKRIQGMKEVTACDGLEE
jgi:hypothetical protein